jgi:hypothetical protein
LRQTFAPSFRVLCRRPRARKRKWGKNLWQLVARMERSVIRDRLTPDYAALHPGYGPGTATPFAPLTRKPLRLGLPGLPSLRFGARRVNQSIKIHQQKQRGHRFNSLAIKETYERYSVFWATRHGSMPSRVGTNFYNHSWPSGELKQHTCRHELLQFDVSLRSIEPRNWLSLIRQLADIV